MKENLKTKYLNYLSQNSNQWFLGVELERLAWEWGYSASNGSRTLRLLSNEGKLKRRRNPKNYAEYAYIPYQEAML